MANIFFLKKEFNEWLIKDQGKTSGSAGSYCSYISGINKTVLLTGRGGENIKLFEAIEKYIKDQKSVIFIIESFINELQKECAAEILRRPEKTIRNWRSGLTSYGSFISDYIADNIVVSDIDYDLTDEDDDIAISNAEQATSLNSSNNTNYIYSKEDLYKVFKFRLITQDRYYSDIYYPIGLIKRLFYIKKENEFFDNWLDTILDNVEVLIENSKISLKSISSLEIRNQNVYITSDKKKMTIFTESFSNKKNIPFKVNSLKQITLDHKIPLYHIMADNKLQLITFQQLTSEVNKYIKGKVTFKKLRATYNPIMNGDFIDAINFIKLKSELSLISSKTDIQLMDRTENTKKGKNLK